MGTINMTYERLPETYFYRQDERDDSTFYSMPRKVVHIDPFAIAAVGDLYARLMPKGGQVLDLMSSWRSHIPASVAPAYTVGLGLNAAEMRDNPQLNEVLVHDLNDVPAMPFADNRFDAVVCAVSVQYMVRPIEIFAAVNRVLKPGAPFIVTFSNRCFPTKAVRVWLRRDDDGHVDLVREYFDISGNWQDLDDVAYIGRRGFLQRQDPLYGVFAYKQS